ncbi:hypothetical protein ACFYVM_03450 [Streptomyces sp. NPDC003280]|uniref:hypothetical protein n=1 Tax=Streptomyces sp. NPDC003280 TaxID=3364680 RepID=UPI003695D453
MRARRLKYLVAASAAGVLVAGGAAIGTAGTAIASAPTHAPQVSVAYHSDHGGGGDHGGGDRGGGDHGGGDHGGGDYGGGDHGGGDYGGGDHGGGGDYGD